MLRSWAVPKGLPTDAAHDRLAVAVDDHDLEHATYIDEHKSIADHGTWELVDRTERRFVFDLHGERRRRVATRSSTPGRDCAAAAGPPGQGAALTG